MTTIEKIREHAGELIQRGAPFTKDEVRILEIHNSLHAGKAFNAGKRNDKHFQQTGK